MLQQNSKWKNFISKKVLFFQKLEILSQHFRKDYSKIIFFLDSIIDNKDEEDNLIMNAKENNATKTKCAT